MHMVISLTLYVVNVKKTIIKIYLPMTFRLTWVCYVSSAYWTGH